MSMRGRYPAVYVNHLQSTCHHGVHVVCGVERRELEQHKTRISAQTVMDLEAVIGLRLAEL